jgi:hypothetical protein
MPVNLANQEAGIERIVVQNQPGQIIHKTLSQKYLTYVKTAGEVIQMVEHLPSKHKALSSIPSTIKNKIN